MTTMLDGGKVPGYKVVEGRGLLYLFTLSLILPVALTLYHLRSEFPHPLQPP